jgi:hypothetical protein
MKRKFVIMLFAASFVYSACKKSDFDAPDLNISLTNPELMVGDTAKFSFAGNADYVNFYSGEAGKEYDKINQYTSAVAGNPEIQFNTAVTGGNATTKGLSVLVSSDFNGVYDQTNVKAATWTDVTSRVTLATSSTSTGSGVVNLNDLKVEGKPLYVAFRFISVNPTVSKQWAWTINNFNFRTKYTDGSVYTNASENASPAIPVGWASINFAGDDANWSLGTNSVTHAGLDAGKAADEDWAISKAFDLNKTSSTAAGVLKVKDLTTVDSRLTNSNKKFGYVYSVAGTYKAVFVISNSEGGNSKQKLATFDVVVK